MEQAEIVVVGGGIAGSALAAALARDGRSVLVLEATTRFDDRVRGESMMPWGVREAQLLGVEDALLGAGAHVAPTWHRYSDRDAEPRQIPLSILVPGVPGSLNLAHPIACQALLEAAASLGASVRRGVENVEVVPGCRNTVRWTDALGTHEVDAALVVGADGRGSVVRRAAGIELQRQDATAFVTGLLLDGVELPATHDVVAEHQHGMMLLLHQGAGRARAYHVVPSTLRDRYRGPAGVDQFLDDAIHSGVPGTEALRGARPAGPCATTAGTDTWTDRPYADGVVLIGDAAGHNDPTAGCGLSIALRDARLVHEAISDASGVSAADFRSYATERFERMRRLRLIADLLTAVSVDDAPGRVERRRWFADAMGAFDPTVFPVVIGMFAGPEHVPADADDVVLSRVRRLGDHQYA